MTDNSGLIKSALEKTDLALYNSIDGGNSWRAAIKTRGARVAKFRKYEEGDHDACITVQMRSMLRLDKDDDAKMTDFSINYMPIVIDKMASRLRVSEITTDDETQDAYISELLEFNNWDSIQNVYFRGAIRDGDSFAMVSPDPENRKWSTESAYDGFSGIVAIYSNSQDYPLWACKIWGEADNSDISEDNTSATTKMHLKVYQPKKITNWTGSVGGQEVLEGDKEKDAWLLDKIPIVHFANLVDNYTRYGKSELRKAIPLQDVGNRTLHSMVMASELSAFKVYYSIGLEVDKAGITPGAIINLVIADDNGKVITSMTSEQIEFLKAVRVGEFNETDISQYTNQLSEIVKHISQVTQTPIYGVTADGNLSGEALKQLEIGLIGKIKRFQNENTVAVKQLIELTAEVQSAYDTGVGQPPKLEGISVNWASPEILDTSAAILSLMSMAEKKPGLWDDDFYRQRIGALLGMTQSQITAEGEKAKNTQSQRLDELTGAAGNKPIV